MAGQKHDNPEQKDNQPASGKPENQGIDAAVSKIWEGPKDGSAPGCVVPADAWQKADGSNMNADEAIKIVQDAAGGQKMEFPPIFTEAPPIGPGPDGRPAGMPDLRKELEEALRPSAEDIIHSGQIGPDGMYRPSDRLQDHVISPDDPNNEFQKQASIFEDTKHLPPEQQKEVKDGIQAVRDRDPKKIAEFLEHATPEEKAAFIKALKDIGYKVEDTPPPLHEQAQIGGTTHEHLRISDPNSVLPSGIDIAISSNGSLGPNNHPRADVAFEK